MYKLKILLITIKTRRIWKKSYLHNTKYTLQYRTDYIVKKIESLFKSLKIEVTVKGYENLGNSGPCLLYGNHQDNVDALAMIYALKAQSEAKDDFNKIPTFIAKHSLQYKSYTRYPLNCMDTFFLDRSDLRKSLEIFEKYGKFVKENKTYGVIFPEGTRNKNGTVGEFKPGSFKIAKKELMPIVPFTINNSVGAFDKTRKEPLKIEVIFHKKLSANSFSTQNTVALAERVQGITKSSFVKPEYKYDTNSEIKDGENTTAAIKWHKKEAKKLEKEAKKERKKREVERKVIEAEEKQIKKYEKTMAKKQSKNDDKK